MLLIVWAYTVGQLDNSFYILGRNNDLTNLISLNILKQPDAIKSYYDTTDFTLAMRSSKFKRLI
ncbi:UNVERIFIED_CONTAM: hypothetical protein NCL1_08944 [Trichonephila clavipes]